MVRVQKAVSESGQLSWLLLGDDYLPIEPVQSYLSYLKNLERSPNTVRSYTFHLKLYWDYLISRALDWQSIGVVELADFMSWLRVPSPKDVISMEEQEAKRTESTVNAIITSVCMFYDFHEKTGRVNHIPLYRSQVMPGKRYKGFLHHVTKGKPVKTRLLKLKVPKKQPKTITSEQLQDLIEACQRIRDKFLVCLLHESGLRIGQALGLRHADIESWNNRINIVPRNDNANGARAKAFSPYALDVTKDLMGLYTQYLNDEFMEILGDNMSDYVFVNLWDGQIGAPMSYSNVMDLFRRLKRKTGIAIHPHMLRHTHATELIQSGMEMAYVQKRLNHASIQTTMDTYVHLSSEDMKLAYQEYLEERDFENDDRSDTKSEPEATHG